MQSRVVIRKRWKISVHFSRNALAVVFAVNVLARALWCCDEFTLGICRCSCAFTRKETRQRRTRNPAEKTIVAASRRCCVLNFQLKRLCALVFLTMNPCFPCTCPVPLRLCSDDTAMIWVNLKVNTAHLELVALFSSSSQRRDVQLSFPPLR